MINKYFLDIRVACGMTAIAAALNLGGKSSNSMIVGGMRSFVVR